MMDQIHVPQYFYMAMAVRMVPVYEKCDPITTGDDCRDQEVKFLSRYRARTGLTQRS